MCRYLYAPLLCMAAICAYASEPPPIPLAAQVAGYKVVLTCGATFNGGKSAAMIAADELTGIRVDFRDTFAQLPDAQINLQEKYVAAEFADHLPPRYAVWRRGFGCAQLPVGASLDSRKLLPSAPIKEVSSRVDALWPFGDNLGQNHKSNLALSSIVDKALNSATYGDLNSTSAVLVTTADKLLIEQYRAGYTPYTSQRTWSVGKAITATILGIAVEQGLVDIKAPANIPEWSTSGDKRQQITLEHLLQMSSGLDSTINGANTPDIYFGGGSVTEYATATKLEATPGTTFKYANNDTMLAVRSLRASLNNDQAMLRFPSENLFHKIGMHNSVAETDWQGNFVLSSQIWTTSRDLGRLGILYLNDGLWGAERILPSGWRDYVSAPGPAQPPLEIEGAKIPGYGAQFWLYPSRFEGMPDDAFNAEGQRGQSMMIIPSRNLVIVRRGYDHKDGQRFDIARFSADILAALED
jgi:CubicO group peptidase (beta-lactamase class C family)